MSKVKNGQRFDGTIAQILNEKFAAKNAQGRPLAGWQKAAWPQSAPFLANRNVSNLGEAVVWFPFVTDDQGSDGVAGWLNLVNGDRSIITTKYVGGETTQEEIYRKVARFIGKNHIVFARLEEKGSGFEFLGVYASERKGNTLIYRRIADMIETDDWRR